MPCTAGRLRSVRWQWRVRGRRHDRRRAGVEDTRAKIFSQKGKKTALAIRFSTVIGGRDSSEVARDPRGFAVKFYTEDGNWDLVGNNLAVFFIRDASKFPDVIHSLKPDPVTFRQEPNGKWTSSVHNHQARAEDVLNGMKGVKVEAPALDGGAGRLS